MPDESCIIRNGETVYSNDPRLLDPSCVLEEGVVIRPEPPQVKDTGKAKVSKSPQKIKVIPQPPPQPVEPQPLVVSPTETQDTETIEVALPPKPSFSESVEDSSDPAVVMTIAAVGITGAAGVAAVGAMANTSAIIGSVKLKISSLLGNKAAVTVIGGGAVTAGAIVAVKALEAKVKNYEKEMKESKLELVGISSSVDRIDLLLSKLENDELDPTVECDRPL